MERSGLGGAKGRAGIIDLMVRRRGRIPVTGLATLRGYWEALRDGGDVPRRAALDPRGMESALDIAFLAELVAPRVARFRLAGSQVSALMGMDLRGMPLSAMLTPNSRDSFAEALERVFAGPAIAELALRGESGLVRPQPRLDARLILLPLRAEDGTISRALGGLAAEGHIGSPPRRLELMAVEIAPLAGAAAPAEPRLRSTPAQGFAEPAGGFTPAPTRGRPKLRVIRNDD